LGGPLAAVLLAASRIFSALGIEHIAANGGLRMDHADSTIASALDPGDPRGVVDKNLPDRRE
jgi:hypothetical protein